MQYMRTTWHISERDINARFYKKSRFIQLNKEENHDFEHLVSIAVPDEAHI